MKILIDLGHPGHVHLYKNLIKKLKDNGNSILVTVKNIKSAKDLLDSLQIPFISLGDKKDNLFAKALYQIKYNSKIFNLIQKEKINIGLGSSATIPQVSKISRMKSIVLDDDDDDVQPLFVKFAHPFCNTLLSPDVLIGKRKKKDTIFYSGYHELAYLHPNWFKPDKSVLSEANLKEYEPFFIMRFNVFKAHHDIGVRGLSLEQKLKLIDVLESYGKIFITTERDIEPELQKYQYKMSPEKIHHFLYYATMFLGDSQTMTSEAAVLGTPAIRCNTFVGQISYLEEEEHKYGLTYGFTPDKFDKMLDKIKELLTMPNLKQEWQKRRERMLKDKIDVTAFLVWFVENYPESVRIMRERPEFQYRFK
ncbi:DUF354 domain-containing protein [Calditrichota bacterium LG25]